MGSGTTQRPASLTDAIAYAEGDTTKARAAAGPDVKAIRAKTKLTQASFAATLRVPVAAIRDWDRPAPDAPTRTGRAWWARTRRRRWRCLGGWRGKE